MKSIQINLRVTEPLRHIGACARISTPVAAENARGIKSGIKSFRGWRWEERAGDYRLLDRRPGLSAGEKRPSLSALVPRVTRVGE